MNAANSKKNIKNIISIKTVTDGMKFNKKLSVGALSAVISATAKAISPLTDGASINFTLCNNPYVIAKINKKIRA
jgi:hypothetical protein